MIFILLGYPLFKIWMPGQGIGFIKGTRAMDNVKVKLGKKKQLAGLTVREFLLCVKVREIIAIGSNVKGFQ
jgi:hypothetical protein